MTQLHGSCRRIMLALFLVAGGCGGAGSSNEWDGTAETLPNGAVRVTNPERGSWESGGSWTLVPELELGALEGDGADLFNAISGLEVDETGRIYVLDRQANELRIFTADGQHVKSVGRSGEGPAEYANANGLVWIAPDSLLVVDQRGNRYSVLTKDGEYVRSVRRALGFYGWTHSGNYIDGRIYEESAIFRGEEEPIPALFGTAVGASAVGYSGAPEDAAVAGVQAAAVDTVLLPATDAPAYEAFSVQTERGGMAFDVPFSARSVYHLDRTGTIWHGHGSEMRIFRSSFAGDTMLEVIVSSTPAAVTREELEEWQSSATVQRFREMGGRLDMSRIPATKPQFDDIYVDTDGYVWVSIPAGSAETVFAVLDPDGRYLGRLEIPGVEWYEYVAPVVRGDRLYLVGTDELDVQRVYVFRIER